MTDPVYDDAFVAAAATAFLDAARFGEVDEDGDPYDGLKYVRHEFSPAAVEAARERVRDFLAYDGVAAAVQEAELFPSAVGHDLYLTGARHGTGFWDRGLPGRTGAVLTAAAHTFGGADVRTGAPRILEWS